MTSTSTDKRKLEKDLAATEKDLDEFECQYNLTTTDFFRQWQAGKTDDRMDFVEWAGLFQMARNLREQLSALEESPMTDEEIEAEIATARKPRAK